MVYRQFAVRHTCACMGSTIVRPPMHAKTYVRYVDELWTILTNDDYNQHPQLQGMFPVTPGPKKCENMKVWQGVAIGQSVRVRRDVTSDDQNV